MLDDVGERRVLQVLDGAEGGLQTVRMVREEGFVHLLVNGAAVVGQTHVLFFVNGFQLGVEEAEDGVGETLAFDHQPAFELVAGDVLLIDGHIVGGEGVGALCADGGHQLVVLVGDGVLGSLVRNGVDFVVDGFALGGVGGVVIDLVKCLDFLQLFAFFCPVEGAEVAGSLEHEVFQIVRKAGAFGGVVLAAHTHGNVGLDAGHVLVDGKENLQTVVERVMDHVHRVVLIGLLLVILGAGTGGKEAENRNEQAGK